MKEKYITIKLESGITANVASEIASKLQSTNAIVYFQRGNRRANAKSIIGIISLILKQGDEIMVFADGVDEVSAIEIVSSVLE